MVVDRASNVSQLGEVDDLDEEPGEVIESAPPLCVGQERELNNSGLKKRLLHKGIGWETPDFGDEVTGIITPLFPSNLSLFFSFSCDVFLYWKSFCDGFV